VDPHLLRGGFRIGFLVLALAIVSLPFQPGGSAEQVVTILAIAVSGAFVAGVAIMARFAEPSMPVDAAERKRYNGRSTRRRGE
jgi:hypothetical protein